MISRDKKSLRFEQKKLGKKILWMCRTRAGRLLCRAILFLPPAQGGPKFSAGCTRGWVTRALPWSSHPGSPERPGCSAGFLGGRFTLHRADGSDLRGADSGVGEPRGRVGRLVLAPELSRGVMPWPCRTPSPSEPFALYPPQTDTWCRRVEGGKLRSAGRGPPAPQLCPVCCPAWDPGSRGGEGTDAGGYPTPSHGCAFVSEPCAQEENSRLVTSREIPLKSMKGSVSSYKFTPSFLASPSPA